PRVATVDPPATAPGRRVDAARSPPPVDVGARHGRWGPAGRAAGRRAGSGSRPGPHRQTTTLPWSGCRSGRTRAVGRVRDKSRRWRTTVDRDDTSAGVPSAVVAIRARHDTAQTTGEGRCGARTGDPRTARRAADARL